MNRREFVVGALSLPVVLRLSPQALAGGTPIALVTADTQARVAAVELATGKILRSISTLPGPRSIESVSSTIGVVSHTAHGTVSLIDGRTLRVRRVLRGFDEPRYTAAAPNGRHAFVTDSGRNEVVTIDVLKGRTVASVGVGGPARHISIDPSGRILWVSLGTKAELVAIVDVSRPAAPRLLRRLRPPFLAHDVGIATGGRHVWVSSGDRGALAVYDRRTGESLRSGADGTVRVQSLRDGRVLRRVTTPVGSYNIQEAFGRVVTPSLDRGSLCILDRLGRLLRRVQVAPSSHDACLVMTA